MNKCYRLVGFPKDFKFTKNKSVAANVSNLQATNESNSSSVSQISNESNSLSDLITNQYQHLNGQYQQLLTILNSHSMNSNSSKEANNSINGGEDKNINEERSQGINNNF